SVNASGGQKTEHALTFQTDHPMGAGQHILREFQPAMVVPTQILLAHSLEMADTLRIQPRA
ncbi:hypothetical protein, partial [Shinella zoogloeoides]